MMDDNDMQQQMDDATVVMGIAAVMGVIFLVAYWILT